MTGPVLLLAAAAAALAAPPPPPRFAQEIVVVAERAPSPRQATAAAVTVLTREEIARTPAATLAELLDAVPGVFVFQAAPWSGPPMASARGFFGGGEAEYLQLRVDGLPVADVESGLADWQRLAATTVERIEVLRGPGSALYGDTALGGVVEVVTRQAAGAAGGTLALAGGSFDTAGADAAWRGAPGGLDVGLAASGLTTDGAREHAAAERWSADLSLAGRAAGGRLRLTAAAEGRERQEPGVLALDALRRDPRASDPLFRADRETTARERLALQLARDTGAPLTLAVWAARRTTEQLRTLLLAAGLADRAFRRIDSDAVGASLEGGAAWRQGSGAAHLRGGFDGAREWFATSYRGAGEDGAVGERLAATAGRRDRLAAFAGADLPAGQRLRLAAGLRWDRIAEDFRGPGGAPARDAWSPRLGAALRLGRAGAAAPPVLHLQLARAFKAPTLDQLFDPRPFPDFAGGTFTLSNPALKPQRAASAELGLAQGGAAGRWQVVAYRMEVEDEIDFDPATFRFVNLGSSLHQGVEADAAWRPAGRWSGSLAYTWTRVEPLAGEHRGRQLKNIPEHRARLAVAAELPGQAHGSAAWSWTGRRFLDDAHQAPLPSAGVLDLRLERAFGRTRVRLDLLNALDRRFAEVGYVLPDFATGAAVPYALPAPGRALRVGLEWDL